MRRTWVVAGLVVAVVAVAGSVALAAGSAGSARLPGGPGMMGGATGGRYPMGMGAGTGTVWLSGNGARVSSIPEARGRAATAATAAGLHPGEVIWFDNGFYVELKDLAGGSATEVIVDPATGAVFTEPGPAMMWNTRYGMHHGVAGDATVSATRARQIATTWLAANLPGRVALPPDSYPGYYTMETTTGSGTVNGMLSVNVTTGQVWYHSWHGRFIALEDA
jgi:hypothetical protein